LTEASAQARAQQVSADTVRAMQAALRAQGRSADPLAVVRAHIAAVQCGDAQLMAADYGEGACITRGDTVADPHSYFPGVMKRLGGSQLVVESLQLQPRSEGQGEGRTVTMRWRLSGGLADGTRGTDTLVVLADRVVAQQVVLHTADF
jgi:hypothetical protein